MFVDLDNFKILNDTLGHDLGDQLLIEVGRRLQGCVRDVDTVARLGGDEFVVMLEFLNEQEFDAAIQANTIAEKVRSTLAELYRLEINTNSNFQSVIEHYSTASVGFVLFMGHETSSEELLKRADLAMYQAKHAGKNEIRAFIPEMQISLNLRTALEIDLRNALSRNELSLYYQVQVDVSGQPVGAEALIRWNQTEHGMIPPSDFIPLAEETGLILPVGKWILRQGCETLAEWANYPETCKLKLAINVSSRQFSQADFVEQIHTILVETGANPMLLKLEITESIILDNVEETIAKMHAIRDLGVNFSMDDFGTGYSSLSYLQRLPLQQLKIDQSFVKNMNFNKHDSTIVRTILALGANLDIEVIAEGVETKVQFEHLLNAGCLVFQGYLYGRPVPADIFKQTLLENRRPKIL
jgi:diguanylate cyclase (GGDEF)-like protein